MKNGKVYSSVFIWVKIQQGNIFINLIIIIKKFKTKEYFSEKIKILIKEMRRGLSI